MLVVLEENLLVAVAVPATMLGRGSCSASPAGGFPASGQWTTQKTKQEGVSWVPLIKTGKLFGVGESLVMFGWSKPPSGEEGIACPSWRAPPQSQASYHGSVAISE
eukprot:13595-Amphidinium_carterae.1